MNRLKDPPRSTRRGMPRTRADYQAALDAAVARSTLSRLPKPALQQLVARGIRLDAAARTIIFREGDAPLVVLVVHGALRIYATSADGREFTVFWAHAGDWAGYSLIAGGPEDVSAQAVSDSVVHVLPVELLEGLARSDAAVAWELARAISGRLKALHGLVRMLAFMDLRERIAQRLLELAFRQPQGMPLVAEVTQQELADLVGSTRTSVARVLADLRRDRIIASLPRGIHIVRPEQLTPSRDGTAVA